MHPPSVKAHTNFSLTLSCNPPSYFLSSLFISRLILSDFSRDTSAEGVWEIGCVRNERDTNKHNNQKNKPHKHIKIRKFLKPSKKQIHISFVCLSLL
mmetsp:Transcript_6216/g.6893  ORF Transcript_6216/g.6893 Transcript_6216/m.6893 type:complete len:97 (+) Transcript_6216:639-929(+)